MEADPRVVLAERHCREINAQPCRWAQLEVIARPTEVGVYLHIGSTSAAGHDDRATTTRSYYLAQGGVVNYVQQVHP